jgi:hypothetical protein
MSEKSILEQALLQVNTLEEAVKQNAKGILSSVMKQELNDLLKESMEEEEEVAEQPSKEEETDDMSDAESDDDAEENDDMASINDEPSKDIDGEDDEEAEDEAEDEFPTFDDAEEPSMDDDMLDMTNASDEEVLKVFKAMSDEDGIIVKKDGANISLKDEDDEYIIKLGEEDLSSEDMSEEDMDMDLSSEDVAEEEEMSDEAIYEIELDGMDDETGEEEVYEVSGTPDDLELPEEEVEVDEAAHTKWNAHGGDRAGLPTKKMFAAGAKKTTNESAAQKKAINEEVQNLKKQNAEYKKALVLFKEKLNEVAVFNANLAYATRLFTEHSTTKSEKLNILKRFDSISTITESKNLYNSINAELGTKKPVTESVANKISSAPSSSSSEVLSESKVYEAPQFARMKDLMRKIK